MDFVDFILVAVGVWALCSIAGQLENIDGRLERLVELLEEEDE